MAGKEGPMKSSNRHPLFGALYALATIVALFTGFGNMPLYGRYYIADVPGLQWSGNFFTNVNVHVLAGSLLLCIGIYGSMVFWRLKTTPAKRLTLSGKIRGALLALTLATGILMVLKNLPGIQFSFEMLMIANFTHMGGALLFMLSALVALIFRMPWSTKV
jgi:hypothetical protein